MRLPVLWRESLPPILAPAAPPPQTNDLPAAAPDFNRRPEYIYGRMEFHPLSWPLECGLEQTFSVICTFTAPCPPHTLPPSSFLRHWHWANISPPFSLSPIFSLSYVLFLSLSLSIFLQYGIPSVIHIHIFEHAKKQCSRSVTFSDGSGSLDPYTGLRIQIRNRLRIWILLFLAMAFKMPTKN